MVKFLRPRPSFVVYVEGRRWGWGAQEADRFSDLLFLAIGGQSPFLSILIYGTSVVLAAGLYGFIAIALGTLLALLNGLVVYYLSSKFAESGGYYTYAYYSLSERFGFEAGWAYLLYAFLYGAAYIFGASWLLSLVLPLSALELAAVVFAAMALVVLLGIRPTFYYRSSPAPSRSSP